MTVISFNKIKNAILSIADELEKNRQYYNDLDSPIGDSDHGDSISSTFKIVKDTLSIYDEKKTDIGELLKTIGKEILFSGGAAMGPLYGSAFLESGKTVSGKSEITYKELVDMWTSFVEAIAKRGNVKRGEKTMYDTIFPAIDAFKKAYTDGKSLSDAISFIDSAAKDGMNSTKDMISLRGRSSRLGKRSVGHIDPGAASMYTIISTFFKSII